MIVSLIPLSIVVIILLVTAGTKFDVQKGGEDKMKNVYLYLVLFSTLMMSIGGSIGTFMAIADIVAPAPYYQSFDEYKRYSTEKDSPEKVAPQVSNLSEKALKAQYDSMVQAESQRQVARARNTLIKSLGWIFIPLPIFIYFQRRLSKNAVNQ